LLRVGPSLLDASALVARADASGVPLVVVDVPAEDVGDAWDGVPLVLVRPDQHVCWRSRTAPTAGEAEHVLATVTGRTS
jgi:hypothetical protein